MDKLTAEQARKQAAEWRDGLTHEPDLHHPSYLYDQIADALEAKERANFDCHNAITEAEYERGRAEQAESRLKEAMRVMWPGKPIIDDIPGGVFRDTVGTWSAMHVMDQEAITYAKWANAFERAFGVKVEEWKP